MVPANSFSLQYYIARIISNSLDFLLPGNGCPISILSELDPISDTIVHQLVRDVILVDPVPVPDEVGLDEGSPVTVNIFRTSVQCFSYHLPHILTDA